MKKTIIIHDIDHIDDAAKQFLPFMQGKNIFAFYGNMGAGKTTFIKALCNELGVIDVVNSPSFAIVNEYTTKQDRSIYHFDFYRIKRVEEIYDIGYEDYFFSNNICLLEWPELIEELLPEDTLKIKITIQADGSRLMTIEE